MMLRSLGWLVSLSALVGCHPKTSEPVQAPTSEAESAQASALAAPGKFRLGICSEAPIRLPGPPHAGESGGCVVHYVQQVSDPAYVEQFRAKSVERRYLVYAPANLPSRPAPLVLVFPGYTASAESAAVYYTHTRFEALADEHGFVVVYANGLPFLPPRNAQPTSTPEGGYLQGCLAEHAGEGIDVRYTRDILAQLEGELSIDRSRVYATGLSAGGGMCFQLALEAPDLVAAIAPVAGLPFQPGGLWRMHCNPRPGYEKVSIAMLAATDDPFIAYQPGPSRVYPEARYPGMEATRDAWLAALGIHGQPTTDSLPDRVAGDSYEPHSGLTSSHVERMIYPAGPDGQELWYYKVVGMGHWWPNPKQIWHGLWDEFGKTNQDIDFADHAWEFFQRHRRQPSMAPTPPGASQ